MLWAAVAHACGIASGIYPWPGRVVGVAFGCAIATTARVRNSAKPEFASISAGLGNPFHLPRVVTLPQGDAGTLVYRTGLDGAVSFYLDGHSVTASVAALQ